MIKQTQIMDAAYYLIDHFLRNNLGDEDYAEYSNALDSLCTPAGAGEVAYLDIGTGGYLDIGTDLTDEALLRLPKGRHALVIAGTYGVDGYAAAPTPVAPADSVLEYAAQLAKITQAQQGDSK